MAKSMEARRLHIYSDSQLVVKQVNSEYQAKGASMISYLELVKELLKGFEEYSITQIPRAENLSADSLAKLASATASELIRTIPVETLRQPSISEKKQEVNAINERPDWRDPIIKFLTEGTLPADRLQARKLKYKAPCYTLINGVLYKRGFSLPYLRCLGEEEADYVLREVHEGICGNHAGGRSLAHKVVRQGYYWPSMQGDAKEFVRKCDPCQRFANVQRRPPEQLTSVTSPWPFAQWGVDLIGPLPIGRGQVKFAIVAIDYFTKWVEAEPLSTITEAKTSSFIWKSIICRFGIPHTIVTDNGKQFDNRSYRDMCSSLGIKAAFSSPFHPQANGQVEAANKIIKHNLKTKLDKHKGAWAEKLPEVLWAYRTTPRTGTGETPFSLAFGAEAVIPVEIGLPNFRAGHFRMEDNEEQMRLSLDLIEEKRDLAQVRAAAYQQQSARYYNAKVKPKTFKPGDLVLRKVTLNTKEHGAGAMGPVWEGPYKVSEVVRPGTYHLEGVDGKRLAHPWNAEHLKFYFQ